MSVLTDALRKRVATPCHADDCVDADCSASLDDVNDDRLLIDLDCDELALSSVTHADFILVTGEGWLACIELKGGRLKRAVEQLQSSAQFAETQLLKTDEKVIFRPVLVHRGEFGTGRVRRWAGRRIEFRNASYVIERIRCEESLADALR